MDLGEGGADIFLGSWTWRPLGHKIYQKYICKTGGNGSDEQYWSALVGRPAPGPRFPEI